MNIYLIRHGRQNSKLCNVNVELSPEGRRQADLVGKRLESYNIDVVYSSDLIRAEETADILNKHINAPRVIDKRLRESNFGGMTGLTNDELKEKYGDFLERRSKMTEDLPYPDGGENCEDVFNRAFEVLEELRKKEYENIAIVTHGGVIRALFTGIVGAPFCKSLTYGRQIENCSISHIMFDKEKETYHIERFNDFAHIEPYDELLRKHFSTGFFSRKKTQE